MSVEDNERKLEKLNKNLVFTHIDPPLGPFLIRRLVTQPFFLSGVSDVYKGEVVIAEDGMHFEL